MTGKEFSQQASDLADDLHDIALSENGVVVSFEICRPLAITADPGDNACMKKPAKPKPKRRREKKDVAQNALAIVEQAIGGKLATNPSGSNVKRQNKLH